MFIRVKYGDMAFLEVLSIFSKRLETFRGDYAIAVRLKILYHVVFSQLRSIRIGQSITYVSIGQDQVGCDELAVEESPNPEDSLP